MRAASIVIVLVLAAAARASAGLEHSASGTSIGSDLRSWTIVEAAPPPAAPPPAPPPTRQPARPKRPIVGTGGPDVLEGTNGDDVILGLSGDDKLIGKGGNDILVGGLGSDQLAGGDGNDELIAGPGRDATDGGAGDDRVSLVDDGPDLSARGGPGRDTVWLDRDDAAIYEFEARITVAARPIVYNSGSHPWVGPAAIWAMAADGSSPVKLTTGGRFPSWSPTGTRIAFVREHAGGTPGHPNTELYVMSWDGSGAKRLTFTPDDCEQAPAWSPDGQRLVFIVEPCKTQIERVAHLAVDNPSAYVYVTDTHELASVRWRADGASIYFATGSSFAQVFRVDPWNPGSWEPRTPKINEVSLAGIDVSPGPPFTLLYARQFLQLQKTGFDSYRIYKKADTADPSAEGALLTPKTGPLDSFPDWNGSGTGIVFYSSSSPSSKLPPGKSGIWKMNADGSGRTFLREGVTPDWR